MMLTIEFQSNSLKKNIGNKLSTKVIGELTLIYIFVFFMFFFLHVYPLKDVNFVCELICMPLPHLD